MWSIIHLSDLIYGVASTEYLGMIYAIFGLRLMQGEVIREVIQDQIRILSAPGSFPSSALIDTII